MVSSRGLCLRHTDDGSIPRKAHVAFPFPRLQISTAHPSLMALGSPVFNMNGIAQDSHMSTSATLKQSSSKLGSRSLPHFPQVMTLAPSLKLSPPFWKDYSSPSPKSQCQNYFNSHSEI